MTDHGTIHPKNLQRFALDELALFTKEGVFSPSASRDFRLFYVGRDDAHGVLRHLLSRATASLYLNMYDDEELDTALDVQKWVNAGRRKGYQAETIRGWFRVLRTMTRDAMEPLGLPRDPTLRISFPEDEEKDDNALEPELLGAFPENMERLAPQHRAGRGAGLHGPALLPRIRAAMGGHDTATIPPSAWLGSGTVTSYATARELFPVCVSSS